MNCGVICEDLAIPVRSAMLEILPPSLRGDLPVRKIALQRPHPHLRTIFNHEKEECTNRAL